MLLNPWGSKFALERRYFGTGFSFSIKFNKTHIYISPNGFKLNTSSRSKVYCFKICKKGDLQLVNDGGLL